MAKLAHMARPLVFALLLFLGVLPSARAADADQLQTKVFVSPYLQDYVAGFQTQLPKAKDGFVDLREYLSIREVELPENCVAKYNPKADTVTVTASADLIERISELFRNTEPLSVRAVFTLVEYHAANAGDFPDLGYETLRKIAGDSWRVHDRITLIAHSGVKVTSDVLGKIATAGKVGASKKKEEVDFFSESIPLDQFGTRVEMEPQIGADGKSMDVSFAYAYRSRPLGNQTPVMLRCQSNTTVLHNVPLVVQTATAAPPKGEAARAPALELAVIVQASLIDRSGRCLPPEPSATVGTASPKRRFP